MTLTVTFPGAIVPSSNEWTFKTRWAYVAHRDRWYLLLRSKLEPKKRTPAAKVYARLTCHRQKLLDYANFVGGAKPIPDGLKHLGYIHDDSPDYFHCEYIQHKVKKAEQRTVLELSYEPLDPAAQPA